MVLARGFLPPLAEGFRQFLRGEGVAPAISAAETAARSEERGGRYDTHPPLGERLHALERMPDVVADDGGPALSLLDDLPRHERHLMRAMLGPKHAKGLTPMAWEEAPTRVYAPWYAELSEEYRPFFGGMELADLPARARGLAITLGDRIDKQSGLATPEGYRLTRGGWAVSAVVSAALARAGWTIVTAPGDPVRLVRAGVSVEPFTVVAGAMQGRLDAEQWSRWCEAHGIADLPVESGARWSRKTTATRTVQSTDGLPSPPSVTLPPAPSEPVVRCWSCKAPVPTKRHTRGAKIACPQCGTKQRLPS